MSRVINLDDNYVGTQTQFQLEIVIAGVAQNISRGTVWFIVKNREGTEVLRKYFVSFKNSTIGLLDVIVTAAENTSMSDGTFEYSCVYVDKDSIPWVTNVGNYVVNKIAGDSFTLKSTTTTSSTTSSTSTSSSSTSSTTSSSSSSTTTTTTTTVAP